MRILITGSTYYPGSNGQAVFTIHLAEGLALAGNEVMAVVPSNHRSPEAEWVNGVLVRRRPTLDFTWVKPEMYVNSFWDPGLPRIIRDFQPDLVHIQDHYPLSHQVFSIVRRLGLPVVGTNHFLPENALPFVPRFLPFRRSQVIRFLWWTMLSLYNNFDTITTPTETAASILRRQPVRVPIQAISCGVDTRRFSPRSYMDREKIRAKFHLDADKPLLIYVGRLEAEKRLDMLLTAFALQNHPEARMAIAGRGTQANALAGLARRLGVADRVTFTGYVPADNLPSLLSSADIFCMPSPEELQSIATLEAMASGKPILAANARALPELVMSGVNGMLFTPGDPADAARAMDALLEDPSAWPRFGQASLERVQKHSLQFTIRRYEEVYRSLIPSRQPEEEAEKVLIR